MNSIASWHSKNAANYSHDVLPKDVEIKEVERENPKKYFKRKVRRAFKYMDADGNGGLDRNEFKALLALVAKNLLVTDIDKIFDYIDVDNSEIIELDEWIDFLEAPGKPSDIIRCDMTINLKTPLRFVKYLSWTVTSRPFNFVLSPGPNRLAAYFTSSTDDRMVDMLKHSRRLTYIETTRVDTWRYIDIERLLEKVPVPLVLMFQHMEGIRQCKIVDSSGNLYAMNYKSRTTKLSKTEMKMFQRPYMSLVNEGLSNEDANKEIYEFNDHCKHCPSQKAWYITLHLIMEDESYSTVSGIVAFFIMFLIAASTCTYVLQTLPTWESWVGWQLLEGVVSILFSVEFLLRVLSCRNISKYMSDTMNIIDFCAVAPFWIEILPIQGLDTNVLRVIRVVRLLRLIRLARSSGIQDILNIYKVTLSETSHWLVMFLMIGTIVLIVFASFLNIAEIGKEVAFTSCDEQLPNFSCIVSNPLFTINVLGPEICRLACEDYGQGGCCQFDIWTGNCGLHNATEVTSSSFSSFAGLCYRGENWLRSDGLKTPFLTVTGSFWWSCVTIMMVGYGEMFPFSELGQIVAMLAATVGLFFLVLPVIVVGFHFTLAHLVQRYKRLPRIVDNELKANQRGTVIQLLEQVNEDVGTRLFTKEDVAVFLIQDTRLNTKQKLEWILRYKNGWSYLPYSYDDTPGLPRVTQFQLFILFTVFGRKFQRARAAQKRDDQRFIKGLKFLMEKKDPRLDEWRDSSGPRRLSSRLSRRIEDRSNESVNHGPLTVIFDNVDPKVIRMSKGTSTSSDFIVISRLSSSQTVGKEMTVLPQGRGNIKARSRRVAL